MKTHDINLSQQGIYSKKELIKHQPAIMRLSNFTNDHNYEDSIPQESIVQPAVIFDGYNVYNNAGYTTIPAYIYNTITTINNDIVQKTIKNTNKLNYKFTKHTIDNTMIANISSVADNFLATILNIYCVFISNINTEIGCHFIANIDILDTRVFGDAINTFLESSDEERKDILKNYIVDFAISYVNEIGISIYNNIRAQFSIEYSKNGALSNSEEIIQIIDRYFARMMGDMTYECTIFANNLSNMTKYLLTAKEEC